MGSAAYVIEGIGNLINYKPKDFTINIDGEIFNSTAYISEALRGGIMAVDKGQWEGAMSLGVPKIRIILDIVLPQAIKNALPSLINESIMLLKDSSLVSVIGVADTLRWADLIQAKTFRAFEAFIVAAAVYYVLVMALSFLGAYLEKKVRISD